MPTGHPPPDHTPFTQVLDGHIIAKRYVLSLAFVPDAAATVAWLSQVTIIIVAHTVDSFNGSAAMIVMETIRWDWGLGGKWGWGGCGVGKPIYRCFIQSFSGNSTLMVALAQAGVGCCGGMGRAAVAC